MQHAINIFHRSWSLCIIISIITVCDRDYHIPELLLKTKVSISVISSSVVVVRFVMDSGLVSTSVVVPG